MRRKGLNFGIIAIGVIVVVLVIIFNAIFTFNDHKYTITVTDKERITTKNGDDVGSKYLVFGDDENGNALVFENTDMLLRGKFNSSNMQGQLKEGETYIITVVGFRLPFFSAYENIIKVENTEN